MKITVNEYLAEGFVASYALIFDNGLIVTGPKLLWLGKEKREQTIKQFNDVLQQFKDQGCEIEDLRKEK